MAQMGFFDADEWLCALSVKGDPLAAPSASATSTTTAAVFGHCAPESVSSTRCCPVFIAHDLSASVIAGVAVPEGEAKPNPVGAATP